MPQYTSLFVLLFYCINFIHGASQVSSSTIGLGKPSSSSSSASRSDEKDGDSSLNHINNHHHNHNPYRHHHHRHAGSATGKKSSHSSQSPLSSSSASSLYPSTSAYGYPDYYNSDSFYEPRQYERPSREFSARSTSYPAIMASAASSQVGFADTEYGGLALATGHGGGHGHGHSHGHGHDGGGGGYGGGHGGHHTTYYKTVNKLDQSSLGLLGLLGLLSLLSNVLMLLTTTARASSMMPAMEQLNLRIKRDAMMVVKLRDEEESKERRSVVERLSRLILPSLNIVGHAKDGRIPINCTYQEVCKTNRVLIEIFGSDGGRPVGSVLSTAIAKLLSDNNNKRDRHHHHYHQQHRAIIKVKSQHQLHPVLGTGGGAFVLVEKLLQQAGQAGRNGVDCEIVYPTCNALAKGKYRDGDGKDYSVNDIKRKEEQIQLPFLVSPERALAIILGESHHG